MDTEYDRSRIERRKRILEGAPGKKDESPEYSELSRIDIDVANDWKDTEIVKNHHSDKKRKHAIETTLKTLVSLAILMIIASGAVLLVQYFDPLRKPSDKNIRISFDLPVSVTPGTPADVVVHITNDNKVALEYANLTVVYPSGTRMATDPKRDMHDEKKLFGTIASGETVEFKTSGIFLGEKNTDKEIQALLEYRFSGINSVFTKEDKRAVHIETSPINLVVNTLKEINSGQTLEFSIDVSSNATIPLNDVIVVMDYPMNFMFDSSDPKPSFGNNTWRIGTLEPGETRLIKMKGVIQGEDTQQKAFYTSAGVASNQTGREISVLFSKILSDVTINRPFIGISLAINGKSSEEAIASYGQTISSHVEWTNNLPTRIFDAQIEVRVKGVALDPMTINAGQGGFYDSNKDMIFWDFRGDPSLKLLEAGGAGGVSFSFRPLPSTTGGAVLMNSEIAAEVTVRGKRISESGVPEEIKTVQIKKVRLSSEAQFNSRLVHFDGYFKNSGPIPPKVGEETTYTVQWTIVNTSNTLTNAEVRASLPFYVLWTGSVYPQNENIRYNQITHEVIWNVGDVPAGTGFGGTHPREVQFQITFKPSTSQIGNTPLMLADIVFHATDSFAGNEIRQDFKNMISLLDSDPSAPEKNGIVVP